MISIAVIFVPGSLARPGSRSGIAITTSMPSITLPNTACLPSRCGVARWVVRRKAATDEGESRINRQRLFASGLLLIAVVIGCANSTPYFLISYKHLDSATFNGRVYNLGAREAFDGDNFCVLCECDGLGFQCQC